MTEIVFKVRNTPAGWIVSNSQSHGPFIGRQRALDLAEGMTAVLRSHGQAARVDIEGEPVERAALRTADRPEEGEGG